LTAQFALYLRQYPNIKITFNGKLITPRDVEESVVDLELGEVKLTDGTKTKPVLTVIHWNVPALRALFLCDEDGFALRELPPGIHAPGQEDFTAYLKADVMRKLDEQGVLDFDELNPDVKLILETAKDKLRDHLHDKSQENRDELG